MAWRSMSISFGLLQAETREEQTMSGRLPTNSSREEVFRGQGGGIIPFRSPF